MQRKKKTHTRLQCIKSGNPLSTKISKLENQIHSIATKLKSLSFNKLEEKEKNAIKKIRSKPKYFYSYAKKLSKTKQTISQLFDSKGNLQSERKRVADILQDQFVSSFSNPDNPEIKMPSLLKPSRELPDITFAKQDLLNAIEEVNENSSCPDYCIPAIVLKRCKKSIVEPLFLMWQESFQVGIIPACYKDQLVTPVYKKGSRSTAANYRPISLTAHEVKVFERVIRDKVVQFLESNFLLSLKQHGFRKGRSCLTQLLKQYDDILLNLLNNEETDVIYLDFAKAFDKVDHNILIRKLQNIGITGKLCNWINNFLTNRNQFVVGGGLLSYIVKVSSGVQRGTVLGPLLFLIFC